MPNHINVAVAVIINDKNQVCISLRHKNSHQGGLWEFPGGKIESGESAEQALTREIKEELGLNITQVRSFLTIVHDYEDKSVCLHVFKVVSYNGEANGLEGQQVKWLPIDELKQYEFPRANMAIINALFLPNKYLITGKFSGLHDFERKLSSAIKKGLTLVQLRIKQDGIEDLQQASLIIQSASALCKTENVRLMLNLPSEIIDNIDLSNISFSGFHLDSKALKFFSSNKPTRNLPTGSSVDRFLNKSQGLISASCHNSVELALALQLKADFVVLSPVQKTTSHPEMEAMGWQKFEQLIQNIPIPVYALGGVAEKDLKTASYHGAQGIAAISAFWN